MLRTSCWSLAAVLTTALAVKAADAPYSIKQASTEPPKELKEPVRKLLGTGSVQFLDDKGNLLSEIWFRKEVPAQATAEQVKNGLTYAELPETTLLGVINVVQPTTDYRKHKIKPGLYTLRLGLQPMDGDHMGTAPHREFCLLVMAEDDKTGEPLATAKELQEASMKVTGKSHPAVLLLFPNSKPAATPALAGKENNHWVLNWKAAVKAGEQKAEIGLGLTLVGHTMAE